MEFFTAPDISGALGYEAVNYIDSFLLEIIMFLLLLVLFSFENCFFGHLRVLGTVELIVIMKVTQS